jgi:hypothetical protein
MYLHIKDVERIQEVLNKFPDITTFRLEQDNSSGIGSVTTMMFGNEVNGISGEFKVEISGVENW